ncbi:hypothetical protein EC973_007576 [Apophysomyces ossiformis]|uniref:Major facilitator superfamily (MFS) profile domain-containing protein n=1 Tax=Apophysomyces ossiformis TaxID=679940 RepID=A0A8H7BM28_9FUNG|nr:hypothetical protein EC973_007576 [Apophysomyces ossiformis]
MTSELPIKQINEEKFVISTDVSEEDRNKDKPVPTDTKEMDERTLRMEEEEGPDGGYGWFVVLGAFLIQSTSFGVATCWGKVLLFRRVMQDYYEQHMFGKEATVQLSFIGSLILVFLNSMGPVAQILRSVVGIRMVILIGLILVAIGLEMAGFATQIWHFYLTQGVLYGSGSSLMFFTVMAVAPQYFTRRRGLALGIIASGSGIGGLVLPFVMSSINASLGPGWTYRVMGFICFACGLVAMAMVKEYKPKPKKRQKLTDIIDFSVLKDFNFVLFCVASDLALLGYFVPYFYLPSYATSYGISYSDGSALVAVAAAANFIGRIFVGYLADRIGRLNTSIIYTILGGLSSFLVWTFAYTYGVMMLFSILFGLFCGSYFALLSPIGAFILGMKKFPSGLSLILLTNIIGVFGPNIAGAIEPRVNNVQPYFTYQMFTGICYFAGTLCLIWLRLRINRKLIVKI